MSPDLLFPLTLSCEGSSYVFPQNSFSASARAASASSHNAASPIAYPIIHNVSLMKKSQSRTSCEAHTHCFGPRGKHQLKGHAKYVVHIFHELEDSKDLLGDLQDQTAAVNHNSASRHQGQSDLKYTWLCVQKI